MHIYIKKIINKQIYFNLYPPENLTFILKEDNGTPTPENVECKLIFELSPSLSVPSTAVTTIG